MQPLPRQPAWRRAGASAGGAGASAGGAGARAGRAGARTAQPRRRGGRAGDRGQSPARPGRRPRPGAAAARGGEARARRPRPACPPGRACGSRTWPRSAARAGRERAPHPEGSCPRSAVTPRAALPPQRPACPRVVPAGCEGGVRPANACSSEGSGRAPSQGTRVTSLPGTLCPPPRHPCGRLPSCRRSAQLTHPGGNPPLLPRHRRSLGKGAGGETGPRPLGTEASPSALPVTGRRSSAGRRRRGLPTPPLPQRGPAGTRRAPGSGAAAGSTADTAPRGQTRSSRQGSLSPCGSSADEGTFRTDRPGPRLPPPPSTTVRPSRGCFQLKSHLLRTAPIPPLREESLKCDKSIILRLCCKMVPSTTSHISPHFTIFQVNVWGRGRWGCVC